MAGTTDTPVEPLSTTSPARDVRGGPELQPEEEPDAIRLAADQPQKMEAADAKSALEWFLEGEGEGAEPSYTIQLNVSTQPGQEEWVDWVIKPLASTRIDELRRMCQVGNRQLQRARRRAGEADLDMARFNSLLVYEATVDPDLSEVIRRKQVADPSDLITHRFSFKPLLVDQIAGEVLRVSGGDEDDMRTAVEVRAAGNS